jgi:hypothetical protein
MVHRAHPHAPRIDVVRAMMAQHRKVPRAAAPTPAAADRRELWQRRLAAFVHPPRGAGADEAPRPGPPPGPRGGDDRPERG